MLTLTLYTKENCHLCDVVKADLASLSASYPHNLTEVDITQDAELYARYRYIIPVVQIGTKTLKAPISLLDLRVALHLAKKG
jgi:hypothetical protein